MRESLALGITLFLAFGAASCSLLVDASDPQCESNADCVASGLGTRCEQRVCVGRVASRDDAVSSELTSCLRDSQCKGNAAPICMRGTCVSEALADRWLCEMQPDPDASQIIHYSFQVLEFRSRKSPGNVRVLACRTNDVTCENPVASFVDTKGDGLVELELPAGFSGFFEVKSDALTALSYLTKPLTHDQRDRDLQVSAPSTLKLLAMLDGTEVDDTRGLALVEAFDCSGTPAGGVHFEESKGTSKPFYIVDNTPNSAATVSVYDSVHDVADGGFINVEPGFVTFRARWGVDGPVLGEFNTQVRANTFTFVDMYF